jgi:CubicO group peptidase (beta-lactamase class C family)
MQTASIRGRSALLLGLIIASLTSCSSDPEPAQGADPSARAPFPSPTWEVRAPEARGMTKTHLDAALDYAFQDGKNTQGVLVVRGRAIVAERYEPGRDERSFAGSWSVAKSFTSAAVGIAIGQGLIPGVDVAMTEYFPDWAGTAKASITLRHVLNMASGLKWQETYDPATTADSDVIGMVLTNDALGYAASREVANPPGTVFNYSSGDTMLVSGVLAAATGESAAEFATRNLFSRIGMSPTDWWRDATARTLTYCCLDTPTREFAKLGLLFLERGSWNGVQVIPESWIQESIEPSPSFQGYGYFWWLIGRTGTGIPADTYAARGVDGQFIYVIPSLDLVVVRNGHYDKHPGDSLADPNLVTFYPPSGLSPGKGTVGPNSWSDTEFIGPIVRSIDGG